MKRIKFFSIAAAFLTFAQVVTAGQIIGQITDPCNVNIDDYTDILSSRIERDGVNLTFVMEMRGNVPNASSLPDFNDTIVYIWLVDADNNPATGQNPGAQIGSEFNVRAVISQNPALAGGYVDVVGSMNRPGVGGTGTVEVNGSIVKITINRSQIASVRRFHWHSDSWRNIGGETRGNGTTPESGLARVCRFGVLPVPDNCYYKVGDSYLWAALETDPYSPVIDLTNSNGGIFYVCLPLEKKWPDQDNAQINAQATGHSGPNHLRMLTRFDLVEAETAILGYAEGIAIFIGDFYLDGNEGETGPISAGVFLLKLNHDYHIFAADVKGQGYCTTYAQVVITQVDPLELKAVRARQDRVQNEERFNNHQESIDLADYGLELGVLYRISVLLLDRSEIPEASVAGSIFSDSTLQTPIDIADIPGDGDNDWDVDLFDFAQLAENWLTQW
jgi:hypothetical protein